MQSGAYQNGTWVVGVAKAGIEEGVMHLGQSQIIAPSGETVAMCTTLGDELAVARCDPRSDNLVQIDGLQLRPP